MERSSALPCRVYAPGPGWFGVAKSWDSVGLVVLIDGQTEPGYVQPLSVVEVIADAEGQADLIDGRAVLHGELELPPSEENP